MAELTRANVEYKYRIARFILPAEYNKKLEEAKIAIQRGMLQTADIILEEAQDRHTAEVMGER